MLMSNLGGTGCCEFLASKDFNSVPCTVAGSDIVKAGSPMTSAGAVATTESQTVGLLMYDVDPSKNPNGALLVQGVVNAVMARQISGCPLVKATIESACPGLYLRENAPKRYTASFRPPCIALSVTSAAGATAGKTALTVSGYTLATGDSYVYSVGDAALTPNRGDDLSGWTAWDGSSDITAATGKKITVAVIDSTSRAVACGNATVTAKA